MSPAEGRVAFEAFAAEIGSRADTFVSLSRSAAGPALGCSLYPHGIGDKWIIRAEANDFAELLEAIREAWANNSEAHALKIVREMALAIIDLTDQIGECTDASLRARFDAADVTRYAAHAVAAANEMAGNGPFSIVALAGANDAVAA